MLRKTACIIAMLLLSLLCVSCETADDKTVRIAVMGHRNDFYPDFEAGIIKATDDLNKEHADKGFKFEYTVYDDDNNYEQGAKIIDMLAQDKSTTAVVASLDMDINSTAAYVFNENRKLFVVPYSLSDKVYDTNVYTHVLSLANSGKEIGQCLAAAAERETNAKRWVVCSSDDEFSMSEMQSFMQNVDPDANIRIVDCCDIVTVMSDFDAQLSRWKKLGVDGAVIFPGSDYKAASLFELVKRIREGIPGIVCMGDSRFDDSSELRKNEENKRTMTGFIAVSDFHELIDNEPDPEFDKLMNEYRSANDAEFDLWYLHAYNMIRMIGDTAVEKNTNNGTKIAEALHEKGYDGVCQKFEFEAFGSQSLHLTQYYIMRANGMAEEVTDYEQFVQERSDR